MTNTLKNQNHTLLLAALLALLLHLCFFILYPYLQSRPSKLPFQVQTIAPQDLSALKNQWKKQLLLDDDLKNPTEDTPIDAKFESSQNQRVEKETRARNADVLPRKSQSPSPSKSRPLPSLQSLGLGNYPPPLPATSLETGANTSPGHAQNILDPRVSFGAENLLNTQKSKYYSFYSRVYRLIGGYWQGNVRRAMQSSTHSPQDYQTDVRVLFDEQGNLLEVQLINSSGSPIFDQVAVDSWKPIRQVPNPPRDLIENGVIVTEWSFLVHLDAGSGIGFQFAPTRY